MNFSAKPTNQLPVVVHRMRRFKFELHHQIIDEHTGICARHTHQLAACLADFSLLAG